MGGYKGFVRHLRVWLGNLLSKMEEKRGLLGIRAGFNVDVV